MSWSHTATEHSSLDQICEHVLLPIAARIGVCMMYAQVLYCFIACNAVSELLCVSHGVSAPHRGSDITLFLLHGMGGRSEQWIHVIQQLQENTSWNLVAPDLIGHGRSSRLPKSAASFQTSSFVDDLEALLQQCGSAHNILIGHSYGAMLSTTLAWRQAANLRSAVAVQNRPIDGLVLVGSPGVKPITGSGPLLHCCDCFLQCIRPMLSRISGNMLFHPSTDRAFVRQECSITYQNDWNTIKGLGTYVQWLQPAQFAQIQTPIMLVCGSDDQVTPLAGTRDLAAALVNVKPSPEVIVVKSTGHNVMMEAPDQVAQAIQQAVAQTLGLKTPDKAASVGVNLNVKAV